TMKNRYSLIAAVLGSLTGCGSDAARGHDAGSDAPAPPDGAVTSPLHTPARLTFESGAVRPLAVSADATRVFVANTPNGSLDILRVTPAGLVAEGSVAVGIDPVAVAVRNATEVWVVNHVSDSVSVV